MIKIYGFLSDTNFEESKRLEPHRSLQYSFLILSQWIANEGFRTLIELFTKPLKSTNMRILSFAILLNIWFLQIDAQVATNSTGMNLESTTIANKHSDHASDTDRSGFFMAYESLEMAMNRFQNFAGEFGYRFNERHQLRLTIGEVRLTERHLSSKWEAAAVDGENVEGYFRIYELYGDRYFGKRKNFYFGGSIAYVHDKYNHTISDNFIDSKSLTAGFSIGYRKDNLFKLDGLYVNASMPFRYYFNDIPETQWGETKILPHKFVNNLWLFIGYHF